MSSIQVNNSSLELPRRLVLWTVICGVSALPSFVWAKMSGPLDFDIAAMLTGIAIAIVIYTWATGTAFVAQLQARPRTARALRIGYLVRMFLSFLFPLGMAVDLIPGFLSGLGVNALTGGYLDRMARSGGSVPFKVTLSVTLLQGLLLNLIGFAFMWLVYLVLSRRPDEENRSLCEKCGYDLRASYQFGRCPECGTPCIAPPDWEGPASGFNS